MLTRHWPLWLVLLALWSSTAILLSLSEQRTAGHLIYSLDDAYIHMAMAKNLALHGVYGVTRYEFSSSSSSPLWTLLLALFDVLFGVHDSMPLILELVVSSLVLVAAYLLARKIVRSRVALALSLLAIIFFTPLPLLISSGMEHPLHILLAILFVWYAAKAILDDPSIQSKLALTILVLVTIAMVLTRFESYSFVLAACTLLAVRRRWKTFLGVLLAGIVPLVVYQAVSVAHGWHWLPNSILVRGHLESSGMFNSIESVVVVPARTGQFWNFLLKWWDALLSAPYLAALLASSVILLIVSWKRSRQFWGLDRVLLLVYIVATLAHLQFGRLGFFFRYEAYLIALGVFILTIATTGLVNELRAWMATSRLKLVAGCGILLLALQVPVPLLTRSLISIPTVPLASQNIYEQQYQMGTFLKEYYTGKTVAANDVGAICYLADIHLVDIVGLASLDVYDLKQSGEFNTENMIRLCKQRNVSIAVAYEIWLELYGMRGIQRQWKKVGMWKIRDDVVCGSDVVTFFAVDSLEEQPLLEHFRTYCRTLPHDVGYWIRPDQPKDPAQDPTHSSKKRANPLHHGSAR